VGYYITDSKDSIELWGWSFYWSCPCSISFRAGYEATQSFTLVSGQSVTPSGSGVWSADVSVTQGASTLMTKVASAPAVGQYSVDTWGAYSFNAADAGSTVTIKYGYTPSDLSMAVTKLIGEWYSKKDRIGLLSKSLGGQETVSFLVENMSQDVFTQLQQYVNVVPY
jgi:hypothetical protein